MVLTDLETKLLAVVYRVHEAFEGSREPQESSMWTHADEVITAAGLPTWKESLKERDEQATPFEQAANVESQTPIAAGVNANAQLNQLREQKRQQEELLRGIHSLTKEELSGERKPGSNVGQIEANARLALEIGEVDA